MKWWEMFELIRQREEEFVMALRDQYGPYEVITNKHRYVRSVECGRWFWVTWCSV